MGFDKISSNVQVATNPCVKFSHAIALNMFSYHWTVAWRIGVSSYISAFSVQAIIKTASVLIHEIVKNNLKADSKFTDIWTQKSEL